MTGTWVDFVWAITMMCSGSSFARGQLYSIVSLLRTRYVYHLLTVTLPASMM